MQEQQQQGENCKEIIHCCEAEEGILTMSTTRGLSSILIIDDNEEEEKDEDSY